MKPQKRDGDTSTSGTFLQGLSLGRGAVVTMLCTITLAHALVACMSVLVTDWDWEIASSRAAFQRMYHLLHCTST